MSDYSRLIEIFESLVGFRTVTGDRQATADCLDYCEKIIDAHGLSIDRFSSNGFESLVATTQKTKHPKLLLQAHIDVVPGDDSMFQLVREGGTLHGRGAYDMKYAVACFLHLVEELGDKCRDYDFGIMLTADEEHSGYDGVKYLLDQGYGCEVCFLPDGGDNWRIETAAKGAWIIDVECGGKSAHGSRPWDGDNAAVKMIDFLRAALALAPVTEHTDTSIVVSRLQSGNARNQVPDSARASLDIRFLNQQKFTDIQTQINELMATNGICLTNELRISPVELDVSLPAIQEWERTVSEVRGEFSSDGYALSFGASDARFFHEKGIPAIVTRPDGGGMHSDHEWIDEAGLYQFYDCIRQYTETMATLTLS